MLLKCNIQGNTDSVKDDPNGIDEKSQLQTTESKQGEGTPGFEPGTS